MKVIICVSNVRSRKKVSKILKEVAEEIEKGHDTCVLGSLGLGGLYTYDVLKGNPDIVASTKFFTL